jgi:hypothetical protein
MTTTRPCVRVALLLAAFVLPASLAGLASSAAASQEAPAWTIRSLAQPTDFSAANSGDSYTLLVTNVGNASATSGGGKPPIVISDTLAPGVNAVHIEGEDLHTHQSNVFDCTLPPAGPLQCVDQTEVPASDTLRVAIDVAVEPSAAGGECKEETSSRCVENSASVSGGGAPAAATSEQTPLREAQAGFGIRDFGMQALSVDGTPDVRAGGHPFGLATTFDLNTVNEATIEGVTNHTPEELRDIVVDLPLGFLGDPQAAARCPLYALLKTTAEAGCRPDSRVGTLVFESYPGRFDASEGVGSGTTAVYNMMPEAGYQAEFGFTYLGNAVFIYARAVRIGSTYGLQVTVPGIPELHVVGTALTLFGEPGQRSGGSGSSAPFFTNPVDCAGGSSPARIEVDTWQHPGVYYSREAPAFPRLLGCEMLQFQPTLNVQPGTTRADEPSGYGFEIEIPQNESSFSPATPELRNATVTLPPGVSVSASASDGLEACEATGPHGIDIPTGYYTSGENAAKVRERVGEEVGEGEAIGPDGFAHLTPGHCPSASTVGTVELTTPLLPSPLEGHLYLGQPGCGGAGQAVCTEADAADGNLVHVYLEAAGSGVVVKLPGSVYLNNSTGQITATFTENPQLPVGKIALHLAGGPRASLANPLACGTATTTSDLTPWSSPFTPDGTPASSFAVDWDGKGGAEAPCPASPPLTPSLSAGTVSPAAGAFSPFTFTLSRGDRQQYLSQLSVSMPPGLLAILSSVPLCGEPQAARGTCPAASEIGTATIATGAGSHPFWTTGHVFLTDSYRGAPFGLSIVTPAKAGPFNLGQVVVRSAISVDPNTTALTVTSDPLPQILDGIPLRIQTVNVTIGRPDFIFNPTNCSQQQIAATAAGSQGGLAHVSIPFAAAGCRSLPFSPKLIASTQAKTSKSNGASLVVKFALEPGQANIRSIATALPKLLPARLTTIQRACLAATFEANPATCPPASVIGIARVRTPVLPVLFSGPVYLVSNGSAAFPDIVLILQGDGIRVDQTGAINISRSGITSSAFANVPDVPLSSLELSLPEGPHSALTAIGSLCAKPLTMPTTIIGQNGAQVKQSAKITVSGCPKPKKKKAKKAKAGKTDFTVSVGAGQPRSRR